MRTALLAAIKRTGEGQLRSLLPMAGRNVLQWQIDLASSLGCERIICLSDGPEPALFAIQQDAEEAGLEFLFVRSVAQLASLLRTDDELVVMLDGLIVDRTFAASLVDGGYPFANTIFTANSDDDLAALASEEFERIGANRIWAGFLTIKANRIDKLGDFPPDCDVPSVILRIALQGGAECVVLDEDDLRDGSIVLATSLDTLRTRHASLIERYSDPLTWAGPVRASAVLVARRLESAATRLGVEVFASTGFALIILGAVLAWLGFGVAGLATAALGSFACLTATSLMTLRQGIDSQSGAPWPLKFLRTLSEITPPVVAVAALMPSIGQVEMIALPILSFGLVSLAARDGPSNARAFWSDQPSHLLVLAIATTFGGLEHILALFGLGALGYKLLRLREN